MLIRDIMSRDVVLLSPDAPIENAAKLMAEHDIGALPVGERDRLIGMITDHDIAVRGIGGDKAAQKVRDVMTVGVKYVFEDETTEDAARNMGELQVRRLPVVNREKRLVGIIAISDLAGKDHSPATQRAIEESIKAHPPLTRGGGRPDRRRNHS
jgi:CBS domain-containing protein